MLVTVSQNRSRPELSKRIGIQVAFILFLTLFFGLRLQAQPDKVYSSYSNETEITASGSITLKSGFFIPSGNNARIYIAQNNPFLNGTPSSNQNYISTRVFRDSAVTELNVNAARTVSGVSQTVQYFDGLGRLSQTVVTQGSPEGQSLVTPVSYDAFGREDKKYDSYVSGNDASFKGDAVNQQSVFYQNPGSDSNIKSTPYPFSQTVFEASPLNRVREQGFQGAAWQPYQAGISGSGHTLKTDYQANIAADAVKLWNISGTGANSVANYAAGTLYKTVLKDENWVSGNSGTVEEFKDKEGRLILKKLWQTESAALSTYYVYDDLGNLAFVLPPAVTVNSFTEALSDTQFNQYIYAYRYDGRNRLIRKKIPGKGWEEFVYDNLDQLVFSQDSVQKAKVERSFYKYDALGRQVVKGYEISHTLTRPALQAAINVQPVLWESSGTGGVDGYTNNVIPQNLPGLKIHQINYYDDYSFPGSAVVASSGVTGSNWNCNLKVETFLCY
ncbi:hypothetical protein AAKU52_001194 [Pedobacter sp. CG_S7]|uniref:DUF6443 domain-containing protein n=1 Tax=Pedobacter sp. CG_S7 TaxID=3143930 RepID=UPI0033910783